MPRKKPATEAGLPDLSDPKIRAAEIERITELLMIRHYEDYKLLKAQMRELKQRQRYAASRALTYMFRLPDDQLNRKSYKQLIRWMDEVIAYIKEQSAKEETEETPVQP